jgi:hypothetical protein
LVESGSREQILDAVNRINVPVVSILEVEEVPQEALQEVTS